MALQEGDAAAEGLQGRARGFDRARDRASKDGNYDDEDDDEEDDDDDDEEEVVEEPAPEIKEEPEPEPQPEPADEETKVGGQGEGGCERGEGGGCRRASRDTQEQTEKERIAAAWVPV